MDFNTNLLSFKYHNKHRRIQRLNPGIQDIMIKSSNVIDLTGL